MSSYETLYKRAYAIREIDKLNTKDLAVSGAFPLPERKEWIKGVRKIQVKIETLLEERGIINDDLQGAYKNPIETKNPLGYLERIAETKVRTDIMLVDILNEKREITVMTKCSPLDIFERYLQISGELSEITSKFAKGKL